MSPYYPGITMAGLKTKKSDDFLKFEANALVNNIGGFTDPELWEKVKELHGGITRENQWTVWGDYWKALGKKGSRRYRKFETDCEYAVEKVRELI